MAGTIKFNYSFIDGSGSNLSDISLYNQDSTLSTDGSGVWTSDIPFDVSSNAASISPYSFKFNGGDYFKKDVSDNWSGSFTFSIWTKPTDIMSTYDSLFSSDDSPNTDYSWQLDATNSNTWNVRVRTPNNGVKTYNFGPTNIDSWQHIAVTWSDSDISANKELKMYYNGSLVKTINSSSTPSVPEDLNFIFTQYK